MLSKRQLQIIEQNLVSDRLRLLGRLGVEAAEPVTGATAEGSVDNRKIVDLAGRDRSLAVNSVEREILEQIEAAIARIAAGDYGTCEQCGKPINPERLEAVPYATLCIACQSAADT